MALCYVKNGTIYVKNGTLLREKWHHYVKNGTFGKGLRELREKWHPSGPVRNCVKNGTR
jgi:hypothetical protein